MTFPSPCLDCADRHVGCHSTCPKYLEAKEQHEKRVEEAVQREKARVIVDCYRCRRADYAKKIQQQQRKKHK